MTDCVARFALSFRPLRAVDAAFDAPQISSDGGLLLVRQLDETLGLTRALAAGLPDERQAGEICHGRQEQVSQRVSRPHGLSVVHGRREIRALSARRND